MLSPPAATAAQYHPNPSTTAEQSPADEFASDRSRVLGLVQPDLPASGQKDRGQTAPAHLLHRATLHFLPHQRLHRRFQVVAYEVQFVQVVLLGRMKRSFRRRHRKDEPTEP